MKTLREKLTAEYSTENGLITNPGKFEGEPLYVPYFYNVALDGFADETIYLEPEQPRAGTIIDEPLDFGPVDVFIVKADDIKEFPELAGIYAVSIWTSEQGFVFSDTYESEEKLRKQLKA